MHLHTFTTETKKQKFNQRNEQKLLFPARTGESRKSKENKLFLTSKNQKMATARIQSKTTDENHAERMASAKNGKPSKSFWMWANLVNLYSKELCGVTYFMLSRRAYKLNCQSSTVLLEQVEEMAQSALLLKSN